MMNILHLCSKPDGAHITYSTKMHCTTIQIYHSSLKDGKLCCHSSLLMWHLSRNIVTCYCVSIHNIEYILQLITIICVSSLSRFDSKYRQCRVHWFLIYNTLHILFGRTWQFRKYFVDDKNVNKKVLIQKKFVFCTFFDHF